MVSSVGDAAASVAHVLRRIDRLEQIVGTSSHLDPGTAPADPRSIGERLAAIDARLGEAEAECPGLVELRALLERAGIRPKAAGDYSDASGAASLSQKAAVVAASQPRLDAMARQLQQVDQLKEHVEPPYLREMDDMCERLRRLETAHVTARAGAAQLQRRVDELLTAYGTAMAAVNMKFVEWDEALSEQESLLASGVDS